MHKAEAKKKIDELTAQIREHNYQYYALSNPVISDYDFDQLLVQLTSLEKEFPEFLDPNSPTQIVGGSITKDFETIKHKVPFLSLGNTYSEEEISEFDARIRKNIDVDFAYVCELKYDGVAIGLHYKHGELVRAVTRGDGEQGDDVTNNVRTIKSIPLKLRSGDYPEEFEVRGEIFLHHHIFERINAERIKNGEVPFANPRNSASGTLKMQDSAVVAKRSLDCFIYSVILENLPLKTHYESMQKAKKWGFKVSEHLTLCQDLPAVFKYIHHVNGLRAHLGFDIDGVVIKVDEIELQKDLGITAKSPRWAIAYKFKAESVSTKLLSITFQVGRTGSITPVANLQAVLLGGTMVKRASLHNADFIEKLDIREGDVVFVEKGGEVIPKITAVDLSKRDLFSQAHPFINACPECGTPLVRADGEANHYCPNEDGCPPQIKGKIEHFTSRKAMDIEGLGSETIELLFKEGLIRNVSDIYELQKKQLEKLERMGSKSADNLLAGIENSKSISFSRVLFALGIRHVGETVARKLAAHFKNMEALLQAEKDQLLEVEEIGEKIADSLLKWFAVKENQEMIEKMKKLGLQFELNQNEMNSSLSDSLKGLTFVVSGVFEKYSRDELKKLIEQHGGKVSGSISAKTSGLIAGAESGPSKLEKASKLQVKVITENEFIEMLS